MSPKSPHSRKSSAGLTIFQNLQTLQYASKIKALFLVQFDVKTGYVIRWSTKQHDSISLKGVEFKSLPSGLHEVEQDVISFVQPKEERGNAADFYYGVSVYHQNLSESMRNGTRDDVEMFSLGILIDPSSSLGSPTSVTFQTELVWKPKSFTAGLEYVEQLKDLLNDWLKDKDYSKLQDFYDNFSDEMNLLESIKYSTHNNKKELLKQSKDTKNHHYLLKLPLLISSLGPLIFKAWKSALLRERLILFDGESIENICAYNYCLSILSTIPQEVILKICQHNEMAKKLNYIQPIYTIGINDIDWVGSSKDCSFIGNTTDEILLFKSKIYDLGIKFNKSIHSTPDNIPEIINSEDPRVHLKATQRDYKHFIKLLKELNLLKSEEDEVFWWKLVCEPLSWTEMAVTGFFWWASAGDAEKIYNDEEIINEEESNEIEKCLSIVGIFQNYTKKIFVTINDIIENEQDEDGGLVIEPNDMEEMELDPYCQQDHEFLIKLVKKWWNRDIKIGSRFSDLRCC